MTLKHYYNGSLISNVVPLDAERGFSSRASIGDPDTIRVQVDDPTAVLDFVGYKTWSMEEDTCPVGSRVVWRGYVGKQVIGRSGAAALFPFGRAWDLDLIEGNGWLSRRVLRSSSANRPAETVSRRIAWLLTQPGFTGFIVDHGNVEACTTKLDPTDYRTRRGSDVLRDCSEASGLNHWIRWREASSDWELFFLRPDVSELDAATFQVSNVAADVDLVTTWPASVDTKLARNPDRIGSGFLVPYGSAGAFVYARSAATAAEFGEVDQTWPSANTTTRSAALALADRALDQHDEQDERLTSRVRLPAANLNDVRHGQLIHARFSHLPGLETARPCRVVSKAFSRPENLTQSAYDVDLELSPAITPTPSHARLMRPNDNLAEFPVNPGPAWCDLLWDYDGDNPKAGDGSDPKYGAVDYYPVGTKPGQGWTGIVINGYGTIDVEGYWDAALVTSGTVYFTGTILKNGVVVATDVVSRTSGLSAWNPIVNPTATGVSVVPGDVITAYAHITDTAAFALPVALGNSSHRLMVTGDLAVP